MRRWLAASSFVVLLSSSAFAHPGHAGPSLAEGVRHPFSGVDHMLAMVAVGVWAALLGGRARWALPAAFIGVMTVGGYLGTAGVALPYVEAGIAASIVALGLLIACAARLPLWVAAPLVGLFALLHGHAHGTELPPASSGIGYAVGFIFATATLHAAGLGLAFLASRRGHLAALRVAGAGVAAAGVVIAFA